MGAQNMGCGSEVETGAVLLGRAVHLCAACLQRVSQPVNDGQRHNLASLFSSLYADEPRIDKQYHSGPAGGQGIPSQGQISMSPAAQCFKQQQQQQQWKPDLAFL